MAWCILITVASLSSGDNFNKVQIDIPGLDKLVHLVMYSVLSFLLLWALSKTRNHRDKFIHILVVMSVSGLYGILIEILQREMTFTRNFDVYDIIANIIGVLLGCVIYVLRFKQFK